MTARRATPFQRGRAFVLAGLSSLASRLPEGPLNLLADIAGEVWYRAAPARAAQARRNLRRVVEALAADELGSPRVRAAAQHPKALEQLVRSAFRHNARYYLEVARAPALLRQRLDDRLLLETPDVVEEAFTSGRPVIFVGLHFGALELPARFLAARVGQAVAPMETLDDPALQDYFERTRGAAGVRIVGLREARRELLGALRAGIPVGLVGDRDLTGGGAPVTLFGAPATLPLGPALLGLEGDAPLYVVGVRRAGTGRYRGRLERVPIPEGATRRERIMGTTQALAAAFERVVATAPEQWWAVFFPIWPDLETAAAAEAPQPNAEDAQGRPA